jgi:hypothetical protein
LSLVRKNRGYLSATNWQRQTFYYEKGQGRGYDSQKRRFNEENSMKSCKRSQLDENELVVKVTNSSGGQRDIVVRSTRESIRLAGDDYVRFQIIQPKGYEKEKIVHRLNRGYEELLTSVFLTLSEARSARRDRTMRRQHLKLPLPI